MESWLIDLNEWRHADSEMTLLRLIEPKRVVDQCHARDNFDCKLLVDGLIRCGYYDLDLSACDGLARGMGRHCAVGDVSEGDKLKEEVDLLSRL